MAKIKFKSLIEAPLANLYDYSTYKYVIDSIDFSSEDVVLDVGCGTGIIEYILSGQVREIIGIDISKPSIDFLNKNFKKGNAKFYCMDVTKSMPVSFVKIFDKVICIDVLEHVESPYKVLKFILDILKEGGAVNNYFSS